MRILLITATTLALLPGAGCKEGGKNVHQEAAKPNDSATRLGNPPASWKTGPPTSVRKASYLVHDEGGAVADISLTIQRGTPGDPHAVVNQLRAQLGAAPIDRPTFERDTRRLATPGGEALVVDIVSLLGGTKSAFDGRLVAAIVPRTHETWIFRMRGNPALISTRKREFLDWVAGVQPDEVATPPPPQPTLPQPTPPGPNKQPLAGREPTWKLPADWTKGPAEAGCFATFSIPSPNSDPGQISVALLANDGAGPLTIVNHCRNQLGLPPIPRSDLAATIETVWTADVGIKMIALARPTRHTIAAWTPRSDGTWFFMLSGPGPVVAAQRQNFALFLKSIRFAEDPAFDDK